MGGGDGEGRARWRGRQRLSGQRRRGEEGKGREKEERERRKGRRDSADLGPRELNSERPGSFQSKGPKSLSQALSQLSHVIHPRNSFSSPQPAQTFSSLPFLFLLLLLLLLLLLFSSHPLPVFSVADRHLSLTVARNQSIEFDMQ
ncbi:hypothetical protein Droror1_Dr00009012 [Drosera rotundifolia]